MLRGRESLIRLVGKRRRFLPSRQAILSIPISPAQIHTHHRQGGSLDLCGASAEDSSRKLEDGLEGVEEDWVDCPVCGCKVRAKDYLINSHLDACLTRGTKRKLTQRTLFQLNFCSRLTPRVPSGDLEKLESTQYSIPSADNYDVPIETDDNHCNLPVTMAPDVGTSGDGSTETPVDDDGIGGEVYHSSSLLQNEVPIPVDDISGVNLQTFIVGRRFSVEKELIVGATFSLLREPDNARDPNAIKVLLADSKCDKMLGYLPRELAQHLSPLIDNYSLTFEGCIISVPKFLPDAVPVQIVCHQVMSHVCKDHKEIELLTSLWKNVLHIVESTKNFPPSATKYQQNFCLLIQEALKSNPHLFTDREKDFLESFMSLTEDSQRLFIRLYTRKGPWFRISNISYTEVSDSRQAIKELSATGYVYYFETANELEAIDVKDIMDLLTVSQLREIASMFKKNCNNGTRKKDIIMSLFSSFEDGLCPLLPSAIMDRTGSCIKISSKSESLLWRAERLFFLNGEQDLRAFLLVDMGIVKYPTYHCIISEHIFSSRSDFLAYEEAIGIAQMMEESLDDNNSELVRQCTRISASRIAVPTAKAIQSSVSELPATFLSYFSAPWVYSKVVFLGVSFLERERRYKDAIDLLKHLLICFTSDGRRGYWTLRLSMDLEHVGCPNESLLVAEDGLLDPWVRAGSRVALQRRVLRLAKPPRRWKAPSFSESIKKKIIEVHIQGRPLNCETGSKSRFYGEDGEQCGVEQLALQYYAGEGGGWLGVHTETGIWLTIFGLLMWDIIFSDVPNVFHNRFQTAPLDLETDSFYPLRKSHIESQLQKIHDGMAEEILITSWESHSGTACRGVSWDRHSLSELRAAVTCIGGPCLALLCRQLAQDYRSWSSGMPDLLLWRFKGEYRGEAKLVEVKGPRDRLSEQQRAWLLLLMDCGLSVEVCKVSPVPLST